VDSCCLLCCLGGGGGLFLRAVPPLLYSSHLWAGKFCLTVHSPGDFAVLFMSATSDHCAVSVLATGTVRRAGVSVQLVLLLGVTTGGTHARNDADARMAAHPGPLPEVTALCCPSLRLGGQTLWASVGAVSRTRAGFNVHVPVAADALPTYPFTIPFPTSMPHARRYCWIEALVPGCLVVRVSGLSSSVWAFANPAPTTSRRDGLPSVSLPLYRTAAFASDAKACTRLYA